jgi:hypothetical protein|tara:strand:- start:1964 stop:2161 length:198 start_codon:yes stop_codon:yes gene_type:complete
MANKYKIATSLLVFGIICFVSFYLIGSEVDENGYLKEPFALLPTGFISICLSMVLFIVFALIKKK